MIYIHTNAYAIDFLFVEFPTAFPLFKIVGKLEKWNNGMHSAVHATFRYDHPHPK